MEKLITVVIPFVVIPFALGIYLAIWGGIPGLVCFVLFSALAWSNFDEVL